MEDKLILTVKPNENLESHYRSADYDFKLNDWQLGPGVSKTTLEMTAGKRPKLIIECVLDEINIEGMKVSALLKEIDKNDVLRPEVSI